MNPTLERILKMAKEAGVEMEDATQPGRITTFIGAPMMSSEQNDKGGKEDDEHEKPD